MSLSHGSWSEFCVIAWAIWESKSERRVERAGTSPNLASGEILFDQTEVRVHRRRFGTLG